MKSTTRLILAATLGSLTVGAQAADYQMQMVTKGLVATVQGAFGSLTPSNAFANVGVGAQSSATVRLLNPGQSPLTLQPVSLSSASGEFGQSNNCGAVLAAGASCSINVVFAPIANGAKSAVLSVMTNSTTAPRLTMSLAGSGQLAPKGVASLAPGSLAFPTTQVAGHSEPQTVLVANTGNAPLAISSVGVGASNSFGVSHDCSQVPAQGTCAISVTFDPTSVGAQSGILTVAHNGDGDSTVSLSGTGQEASAILSAPVFPATAVGASSTAAATLTNSGVGALGISMPATVAGSAYTVLSSTCPASLLPAASCTVAVRFTPTASGPAAGALSVQTDAGAKSVVLGSTGIQGFATITPSSLSFSATQVGTTSQIKTISVSNTGSDTLTFTGVGLSEGGGEFAQSNNCGAVAVGASCTVSVTFTPTAASARTGTLAFTHNGGGLATVGLTGAGQVQSATLSVPAFADTLVGSNTASPATLTNTGVGPLSVTLPPVVTGAAYSLVSSTCSTSLAVGATCTLTARFTPPAAGTFTGSLAVTTGAGVKTVAVTGSSSGVAHATTVTYGGLTMMLPSPATVSLAQATNICSTGTFNGTTGWRVPTIYELGDVINGVGQSTLAAKGWGTVASGAWYWSETHYSGARWYVARIDGLTSNCFNDGSTNCARPVCVK
jgi:hypothetical protein